MGLAYYIEYFVGQQRPEAKRNVTRGLLEFYNIFIFSSAPSKKKQQIFVANIMNQ